MTIKPGVKIENVTPEAVLGLLVVYSVYLQAGVSLRVTSCGEGKHIAESKHYSGRAFDLGLVGNDKRLINKLKISLGEDWDVILENTHIHIEYDPVETKVEPNANTNI